MCTACFLVVRSSFYFNQIVFQTLHFLCHLPYHVFHPLPLLDILHFEVFHCQCQILNLFTRISHRFCQLLINFLHLMQCLPQIFHVVKLLFGSSQWGPCQFQMFFYACLYVVIKMSSLVLHKDTWPSQTVADKTVEETCCSINRGAFMPKFKSLKDDGRSRPRSQR